MKIAYLKRFINIIIQGNEKASNKNAPTKGTISWAFSEGPYFLLIEFILANALGVFPIPWPNIPATITAASKFFPSNLKAINIVKNTANIAWVNTIISIGPAILAKSNKLILIRAITKNIPKAISLKMSNKSKFKLISLKLSLKFLKI